jgi:NAD(P)-dependent dehydrogenase (short-subunit alcohol dehydrogenase family)
VPRVCCHHGGNGSRAPAYRRLPLGLPSVVMKLPGVTALVTGAARRLGKAIAIGLASSGADLVLHYNRSEDEAAATAEEARSLGVRVALAQGDVQADADAILDSAGDLAPVRVLVNSAAAFPEDTLADVTPEGWNHTLAVNVTAPMFLTKAFADRLPDGEEGVVINLSDWRVSRPYPDHFSYTVSKGALDTFTVAAAGALAPRIRVNGVALGAILPPKGKPSEYLKGLAGTLPLERVGTADAAVSAVLFLIENDFVTGATVPVDGGAHLV